MNDPTNHSKYKAGYVYPSRQWPMNSFLLQSILHIDYIAYKKAVSYLNCHVVVGVWVGNLLVCFLEVAHVEQEVPLVVRPAVRHVHVELHVRLQAEIISSLFQVILFTPSHGHLLQWFLNRVAHWWVYGFFMNIWTVQCFCLHQYEPSFKRCNCW